MKRNPKQMQGSATGFGVATSRRKDRSKFKSNDHKTVHVVNETPREEQQFKSLHDLENSSNSNSTSTILERSVARSGLTYDSFVRAIIGTALSRLVIWDQTDLDRLLLTAERLGLDPLSGEIYAADPSSASELEQGSGKNSVKKGVVIVVSVDGWSRIINSNPQFDGMRLLESEPGHDELPLYFECTIFRKDRKVATSIREYMYEAHTGNGAWLTHPRRMLRHKAMVQCARICFGLAGIYEPDEAQRIISSQNSLQNSPKLMRGSHITSAAGPLKGTNSVKDWVKTKNAESNLNLNSRNVA
jgi:hypothetical protein